WLSELVAPLRCGAACPATATNSGDAPCASNLLANSNANLAPKQSPNRPTRLRSSASSRLTSSGAASTVSGGSSSIRASRPASRTKARSIEAKDLHWRKAEAPAPAGGKHTSSGLRSELRLTYKIARREDATGWLTAQCERAPTWSSD